MTTGQDTSSSTRIAVLFGYNAAGFDALERTKGDRTVEGTLLATLASLLSHDGKTTLNNISRASTTEIGEHASRQVISFDIVNAPAVLPKVDSINDRLPASIRVFRIVPVTKDFSARRTCEARTYEYLIPTYAFAPPPAATHYAYPEPEEDDMLPLPATSLPKGGMFKTMKRGQSLARRQTVKSVNGDSNPTSPEAPPVPAIPTKHLEKLTAEERHEMKVAAERRNIFARVFANLFGGNKSRRGSDNLKANLDATLQRPSKANGFQPTTVDKNESSANINNATLARDDFVTTLKRSMSRHKNFDPAEYNETAEPQYFEPLAIPAPNQEQRSSLRGFRMSSSQRESLRLILSLFNGTHNWHNYIPGASNDDPRCFIRILNIDTSAFEVHEGVEWLRIKVQAPAFARYQIRRMMSMMVMVIRTNTPRSVVGNSFGLAKISIPEAPAFSLILDEPHYNNYNVEAVKSGGDVAPPVNFGPAMEEVENFRHKAIHDVIYAYERDHMEFEAWVRSIDNYSFLYTYFLNERGVIRPQTNFVKVHPSASSETFVN
ncbi:pseudouridine synthase [Entophlyctis helioformis]|nr:pseudouridine synthase [Entophlyctis helioformis]